MRRRPAGAAARPTTTGSTGGASRRRRGGLPGALESPARPAAGTVRIRRARLGDTVLVGRTVARANEAEARHRRQRVRRVRATSPPAPFRSYLLFLSAALNAAAGPTWIATTDDDTAVVTALPLTQPDLRDYRRREAAVCATVGVCAATVLLLLGLAHPALFALGPALAAPVAWGAVTAAREGRGARTLRRRMKAVVAEADGPVYLATSLAGGGRGAGGGLVGALTAWADAEGITLVGRTERSPLVRLYEGHGFEVAAEAAVWWGTLVLVVRRPSRSAADAS